MLGRLIARTFGREDLFRAYATGSNATQTITRAAATGKRSTITKIVWSYSGDPTAGGLTVTLGSFSFTVDITKGGPGALQFGGLEGGLNEAVSVALAAGGAGVTGRLYVEGVEVQA